MPLIDLNGLGYFKGKENAMVAGNYSASNTYAVGDYVYYSGTLYRCTTAITTAEAWTAAHWTAAKLADDLTSQSEKIASKIYDGTFTDGKYLAPNGSEYSDVRCKITDYIAVIPGSTIKLNIAYPNVNFCYGLYDDQKRKISIVPYDGESTQYNVTIGDLVRYIRVTYTRSNGSYPFTDSVIITDSLSAYTEDVLGYVDDLVEEETVVTPEKIDFINSTRNYFNPDNLSSGRLNPGNGNVIEDSNYRYTTYYIPVREGDKVRYTYDADINNNQGVYYKSDKTYKDNPRFTTTIVDSTYYESTIPNGVYYMRINVKASLTSHFVITVNEAYTTSVAGFFGTDMSLKSGYRFTNTDDGTLQPLQTDSFLFEKICCIGDSLTAGVYSDNLSGKGYPYFLGKMLSCDTENLGIGGTTTKTWYSRKDETFTEAQLTFSNYDCFILFFGTNGGLDGTPDPDEDSMLGWYAKIVELIRTGNATAPIFLVVSGWTANRDTYGLNNWITQINLLATEYTLPVIRLDESLILTYENRLVNQAFDHTLHYGMFGYLRVASEMINFMSKTMDENGSMFAEYVTAET